MNNSQNSVMKNYNFNIGPTDTDSISFCKMNGDTFSEQERAALLAEINKLSPEFIEWEDDNYYEVCIALKAKNYVLYDGKKKTVKGSAFKSSGKEPAMKEFMSEIIDAFIADKADTVIEIYHKYVREAVNVQDISRWAKKVSATESVLRCKGHENMTEEQKEKKKIRTNESKPWDAIKMEELVQQGDKFYLYPAIIDTIVHRTEKILKSGKVKVTEKKEIVTGFRQVKHFNGKDHNPEKLLGRVYATLKIFKTILNMDQFTDYTKAKSQEQLQKLLDKNQ